MHLKHLCIIFGTNSKYMLEWYSSFADGNYEFAKAVLPDAANMADFTAMIESCEPIAHDVIGFMDGVALF